MYFAPVLWITEFYPNDYYHKIHHMLHNFAFMETWKT
jgi:hypothetical protein